MEEEQIIEKRTKDLKQKIVKWFKDPYNLALVGILIFAFVIRLYYFWLTRGQALWWDEAEYMLKAKSIIKGTPLTGFAPIRETIAPLFWALLYFIWEGEYLVRFFQVIISTATVIMTYLVARRLFNKKIALLASFFMSVFCIHLFFTVRILVYLWAPLLYLLVIFFFIKRKENPRNFYISMTILAFGIITYFSLIFLAIFLLIFIIFDEKLSLFKNKINWKALGIFLVIFLFFVSYYMITTGVPLPRFLQFQDVLQKTAESSSLPLSQWGGYVKMLPRLLRIPLIYVFSVGLYTFFKLLIGLDLIIKNKSEKLKKLLFIWLWIIIPIFFYSVIEIMQGVVVVYDAFIIPVFPAIFIICAIVLFDTYNFIKKYSKSIALIIVIVIIGFVTYSQLSYTHQIISTKVDSYQGIKEAGFFIKENSIPRDIVFSSAVPAITYYSERATYNFPENESELEEKIKELNPRFMVITIYEKSPEWIYSWPERNPNKTRTTSIYFLDEQQKQPSTIVYEFIS